MYAAYLSEAERWSPLNASPEKLTSMTLVVLLHLGGHKSFSASKDFKIEVLKGAASVSEGKETLKFHSAEIPTL